MTPERPSDVDSSRLRTVGLSCRDLSSRPVIESLCSRVPTPISLTLPLDLPLILSCVDRLLERVVSLDGADSTERLSGVGAGVTVLACGVSLCRGMARRSNTVRSRNVELREPDDGAELCVEGVEDAGGVTERVGTCPASRLSIRLPMLLDRPEFKVPDGLDTGGVRSKIELRVCVSIELPDRGATGTLAEGVRTEGADAEGDRQAVGGVRTPEGAEGLGLGTTRCGELGWLGGLNDGCRWITGLLGAGVVTDRFGIDGAGVDRLMFGGSVRVGV